MVDDGVIKFSFSEFEVTSPLDKEEFRDLESQRKRLIELNLIGEYLPEKIGFGNISVQKDFPDLKKSDFPQFIITGTQTGALNSLNGNHYTRVTDGSLEEQSIACHGPIQASSEALTHGAIYMASKKIKAIVHVHHNELWTKMLDSDFVRTKKSTPYGTKEMALEAKGLINPEGVGSLVMHGHQDGIIFYGRNIVEATDLCLKIYFEIV